MLSASLLALLLSAAPLQAAQRVAVVVGIGSYAELPEELGLPGAREDARNLARRLEDEAGYDQVLLLLDGFATRESIETLLFDTLASQLGPDDTLLFYFTGRGVGGDFDDPYLLPYDVDPEDVQGTGIGVRDFASKAQQKLRVGALAVITDASHPGKLGDLALVGPNGRSWPDFRQGFFALSATSRDELREGTGFAGLLGDGLAGAADISGDGAVTAGELYRYVLDRSIKESSDAVHPADGGDYEPGMVLSEPGGSAAPSQPEAQAQVQATPPASGRSPGHGRKLAGWACLGGAAALGGGALAYKLHADRVWSYAYGDEEPPDGTTREEAQETYDELYSNPLYPALAVGAGVFAATGTTLLLLPTPTGLVAAGSF